ncbi:MAG: hypothetical protein ACLGIG_06775 [Actinomycetes bacterium]
MPAHHGSSCRTRRPAPPSLLAGAVVALVALTGCATSDGAGAARPAAPAPAAEVDGVSQVAPGSHGSSDATNLPGNRRAVVTATGRVIVVTGEHASGLQLSWRDPGRDWRRTTTGDNAAGGVLEGTGTGDWTASIALAHDSAGEQAAWVVWAAATAGADQPVGLRRLTDLDSPFGPRMGPAVVVDAAPLGAYRADVAFEPAPDGSLRGCVLHSRQAAESRHELVATWFTDLDTDQPQLEAQTVLAEAPTSTRSGSLVPTTQGLRVVLRAAEGELLLLGRDAGSPLTDWWAGARGPVLPTGAWPTGVALPSGEVITAAETDVEEGVSVVHRFSPDGRQVEELLSEPGRRQPALAAGAAGVWLVSVRHGDGAAVSRHWSPESGWGEDRVEVNPAETGPLRWPNPAREVDGRLRMVLTAPGDADDRSSVWYVQRPV